MVSTRLKSLMNDIVPSTPMQREEALIFMHLCQSDDKDLKTDVFELDKESEIYKHFKPVIEGYQLQIFLKRLQHLAKMHITLGAFITIAQRLESAGDAVLYAYYIFHKLPKGQLKVTMTDVSKELFPHGFFSEEQLHEIWEGQKISEKEQEELADWHCYGVRSNLIDYVESWQK